MKNTCIGVTATFCIATGAGFRRALQRRIQELAASDSTSDGHWATVETLFRRWEFWGALGLLTPIAAAAIMVLKPVWRGL